MSNVPTPSPQILRAIAFEHLSNEVRERPTKAMWSADDFTRASDLAHSLLLYSDEVALILADPDEFDDNDESRNCYSEVNRIGDRESFELGFDLALEIGARIAANPLAKHNISEIVKPLRQRYSKAVQRTRDEILEKRADKATREMSVA